MMISQLSETPSNFFSLSPLVSILVGFSTCSFVKEQRLLAGRPIHFAWKLLIADCLESPSFTFRALVIFIPGRPYSSDLGLLEKKLPVVLGATRTKATATAIYLKIAGSLLSLYMPRIFQFSRPDPSPTWRRLRSLNRFLDAII